MKNLKWIVLITLFILVLNNCSDIYLNDFYYIDENKIDKNEIPTIDSVDSYGSKIIKYDDSDHYAYKPPYETQLDGFGDCKDKVALKMAVIYHFFGRKATYLLVDTNGDGKENHAMYEINGHYYNKSASSSNFNIIQKIHFDNVIHDFNLKRKI